MDEQSRFKQEKETKTENFTDNIPKVVFDGGCLHEWENQGLDPEGKGQVGCKKCCMGRYYDPKKEELVDGQFRAK
jgi:hypothetical protein